MELYFYLPKDSKICTNCRKMCKPNSQAIDNSLHDPEFWSINKISKEFGASQRLAKKLRI